MSAPLDELYFNWLYSQVANPKIKTPVRTYWFLLRQIFRKEFVWFIPNDDNRVLDGKELRLEFLDQEDIRNPGPDWLDMGCSMLEMLIGLSRRLSFEAEGEPREWFWKLLENIRIADFCDKIYASGEFSEMVIDGILDKVIWRTYTRNGVRGLFPLKHARRDQRNVEIWYQMNEYLLEQD